MRAYTVEEMSGKLTIDTFGERREWTADELRSLAEGGRLRVSDVVDDHPEATHATFASRDGYRASIPLEVARRQGLLFLQDDGSVRLRVEDGATLCWNVKDLGEVRLTVGKEPDSVPENPVH
jgi:hypothetical protein